MNCYADLIIAAFDCRCDDGAVSSVINGIDDEIGERLTDAGAVPLSLLSGSGVDVERASGMRGGDLVNDIVDSLVHAHRRALDRYSSTKAAPREVEQVANEMLHPSRARQHS